MQSPQDLLNAAPVTPQKTQAGSQTQGDGGSFGFISLSSSLAYTKPLKYSCTEKAQKESNKTENLRSVTCIFSSINVCHWRWSFPLVVLQILPQPCV